MSPIVPLAPQTLAADIAAHGAYYGVVCNAGMHADAAFPAMSGEQWDGVLRTNLDAFYNVLQPLIMPMVRRRAPGRIVTLSSVSGLIGNRGQVNYSAAKAGIIGATKALAVELAKRQITVNCVAPGLIATDMVDEHVPMEEILQGDSGAARRHRRGSRGCGRVSAVRRRVVRHAAGARGERRVVLMRRVVVTGIGGVCALGASWPEIMRGLRARRNAIRRMDEWDRFTDMNTRLAGPIADFAPPAHWTRKQLRSMGRVSQLAVRAAELALDDAGSGRRSGDCQRRDRRRLRFLDRQHAGHQGFRRDGASATTPAASTPTPTCA